MYQDTNTINESNIGAISSESNPANAKRKAKRSVNWHSRNTPATLAKQAMIRDLLATGLPFTVRAIGEAMGMSRQLALYHVKKMAASGQLVMVLEPCVANGGLQFKVWDDSALMAHYMAKGQRVLRQAGWAA